MYTILQLAMLEKSLHNCLQANVPECNYTEILEIKLKPLENRVKRREIKVENDSTLNMKLTLSKVVEDLSTILPMAFRSDFLFSPSHVYDKSESKHAIE